MHYHLLLTDERGEFVDIRTVETAPEADRHARLVLSGQTSWSPNRYPGRSWKRGEIAVYLDRQRATHRELVILRCPADGPLDLACLLRALGIPALNLGADADREMTEAPAAPPATPAPVAESRVRRLVRLGR
jgi:hypothetical protein